MRIIQDADVKNKKVFLRVDFNVPLADGKVVDNNRILAAVPTIRMLAESRAKIIIGTHIGRPDGQKTAETSVLPAAKELQRILNLKVEVAPDILGPETEKMVANLKPGGILVLENLRWDKREEENAPEFAQELAKYGEIYVNDAFAVSHRANASVEAITKLLPSYAGLLLQSEVSHLELLIQDPKHPFTVIIGGVKVKDKAGVIERLAPLAEDILIGGGVATTFLKARGEEIGQSIFDAEMVEECKKLLEKLGGKLKLPSDFVKEETPEGGFKIMDIGPATARDFSSIIQRSETILWNGSLGYSEDLRYREGMKIVAKAMGMNRDATTVVAGGDTVGFIKQEKLDKGISFISTGGGAALEFLAGEQLPGITALE
ncbi:MAG: phosphoglycerate kinase [Patescibacteria group bacterium]|jgi:phosphoglycerate kinase